MPHELVVAEMTVLFVGAITVLMTYMAVDVLDYQAERWKQYSLTDNQWHGLCLHLQTLEKSNASQA